MRVTVKPPAVGDTLSVVRTFTDEDVLAFARVSGDEGRHHMRTDAQGRRMVHGLLTASLGTKLGGDLHYVARTMTFEFLRPVFTGDTIRCAMTITQLVDEPDRWRVWMEGVCTNQEGKEVLLAHSDGLIRKT